MRDIRREEDEISKRLARSAERISKIRETEAELFRQLAQLRLDPAVQTELDGRISQAEIKAREMMKAHGKNLSQAEKDLAAIDAGLAQLTSTRAAALQELDGRQAELKALATRIGASIAKDPAFAAKRREASELADVAAQSMRKTEQAEADREQAELALTHLTALRDQLRQEYTLRVVNRSGVKSGVWTFPENNTDASNYYIVVEAIDGDGKTLSLPILNEETGETETVSMWGVRVPQSVYDAVGADKQDDGIIQTNEVGRKSDGFLDVDYLMPTLGGAITRW